MNAGQCRWRIYQENHQKDIHMIDDNICPHHLAIIIIKWKNILNPTLMDNALLQIISAMCQSFYHLGSLCIASNIIVDIICVDQFVP